MSGGWAVEEYIPPDSMEVERQGGAEGSGGGSADGPVEIRNTGELLGYLQRKNPSIETFQYEGRTCINLLLLLTTVCNISGDAARQRKLALTRKNEELCKRLIKTSKLDINYSPNIFWLCNSSVRPSCDVGAVRWTRVRKRVKRISRL